MSTTTVPNTTTTTTTPRRCDYTLNSSAKTSLLLRVNTSIQAVLLAVTAGNDAARELNESAELSAELWKDQDRVSMAQNTLRVMRDAISNQCPDDFPNPVYNTVLDDTEDVVEDFQNSTAELLRLLENARAKKACILESAFFVENASEALEVASHVVPKLGKGGADAIAKRLKAAVAELLDVTLEVNATMTTSEMVPLAKFDSCKCRSMLDQAKSVLQSTNTLLPNAREIRRIKMLIRRNLTRRIGKLRARVARYINESYQALVKIIRESRPKGDAKKKKKKKKSLPVPLAAVDQALAGMLKTAVSPGILPVAVHVTHSAPAPGK